MENSFQPISAVIICKNEAHIIPKTIVALQNICKEIIVVDSGSDDDTVFIAQNCGAKVYHNSWNGYGNQKNFGIEQATHDWIISIDADEVLNESLIASIQQIKFDTLEDNFVFRLKRKVVYEGKVLNFGGWKSDSPIRVFNKTNTKWSESEVHEELVFKTDIKEMYPLNGFMYHYSYKNEQDHLNKIEKYTDLFAQKALKRGKKANFIKLYLAPLFKFIKDYIFRLGFLDGKVGIQVAKNNFRYDFLKYRKLQNLNANK